ncbi:hypothetical protein BDF22DRAFT_686588 [Syncephalis plumigaleata]|nr:hypothetical protein BDF22DRAFT_686588 [Syncephalis plumigaleata]
MCYHTLFANCHLTLYEYTHQHMDENNTNDGYFLSLLAGDTPSMPPGLDLTPIPPNDYEEDSVMQDVTGANLLTIDNSGQASNSNSNTSSQQWNTSDIPLHSYNDGASLFNVAHHRLEGVDMERFDQTDYEEILPTDMEYGGEEYASGSDDDLMGSTSRVDTASEGQATTSSTTQNRRRNNESTIVEEDQEFAQYMQDAQQAAQEIQQEGGGLSKTMQMDLRQDFEEDMAEFHNNLREASGIGRRKTRYTRQPGTKRKSTAIPLQVKNLLQYANSLYVREQEVEAIPYLTEAIRLAPQVEHAWLLLALIKENQGEEERAFVLRFCAAQNARDPDLWCWVADQLRKRGNSANAANCYTKALALQPKDIDILHLRCEAYMEAKRFQRAIEGYETILKLQPEDEVAIHHLLRFYVERGRSHDAILLYERLMEETLPVEGPVDPPLFRWEQANFLAELYMEIGDYERALLVIKRSARRLQLRGTQIVWETRADDVEYNEHPLPIDLRVKLGVCRLALGDIAAAKMHFAYLTELPIVSHQELYHQMAEAYMEAELIHEAVEAYTTIARNMPMDMQSRIHLGRCYQVLGNNEAAAEILVEVANAMPKNRKVREELAKLYETLGEQELALLYLTQVNTLRFGERTLRHQSRQTGSDTRTSGVEIDEMDGDSEVEDPSYRYAASTGGSEEGEEDEEDEEDADYDDEHQLLRRPGHQRRKKIRDKSRRLRDFDMFSTKKSRASQLKLRRRQERMEAHQAREKEQAEITANHFHMLALLDNPTSTFNEQNQYLEIAQALYQSFATAPILYTRNELRRIMEDDADQVALPSYRGMNRDVTEIYGKSTDDWLEFLMKYLLLLSKHKHWEQAHQVLRRIQQTSLFVHKESWRIASKLLEIVLNLRQGEMEEAMFNARSLCRTMSVSMESISFYNAIAPRNIDPNIAYGSPNAQKFARRYMSVMVNQAMQLIGDNHPDNKNDAHPLLRDILKPELFVINGNMFMVGRSYHFAVASFVRAYRLCPLDPMISLQLGIAHIHRAMQRRTENRHAHILRGFTFLVKYAQLRGHTQETAYNLGRAFQQIGLYFLAIPQYERALQLSHR